MVENTKLAGGLSNTEEQLHNIAVDQIEETQSQTANISRHIYLPNWNPS